jgi:predicted DNA-binding transcriptional regulator AlpA
MTVTDTGLGLVYIDGEQVRERYGQRSKMWLWRMRDRDPDFPKPVVIGKRNYWRLADLIAWEGRLADAS